jgi:hypothetical protein
LAQPAAIPTIKKVIAESPARPVNSAVVRAAVREVKKTDYNERIATAKPKKLEGKYRIFYVDAPWKYVGLNQADEYGHAERHYDCLDDQQLIDYHPGGGAHGEGIGG